MKTIGLCMIVKNESRVILRCLDSVRALVDYVLIEDTGSTDGTQQIIRDWLARENLPGEIFDEPWRDFAHNRTIALARLRERPDIDYALIMDADDVLVLEDGFDPAAFKARLDADYYNVSLQSGGMKHHRAVLCRNALNFHYRGVLHEYLVAPEGSTAGWAGGMHVLECREGARSQDPEKYRKDALVLEEALQRETDPFLRSRYTFYLGQSWRDCGETKKALVAYLDRADQGFWDEEVFLSLNNAALLKEQLGHPGYEIIGMFLHAFEACPRRAESLHAAARYCRMTNQFHQGYMLAKQGLDVSPPGGGLFLEPWVYEFGLLDELAVNAYWSGHYRECLNACERLLIEGKMPEDMRERVEFNASCARERLTPEQPPLFAPAVGNSRNRASEHPRVFIHANWRTASTWFWSKFREAAGTTCYFEPFNELFFSLTREQAQTWDSKAWESGHPPGDPYCLEYMPLIRRAGGLRLFDPAMPFEWYFPQRGLRGGLRDAERRYVSLLIRNAERRGRTPVLGFTRSLGRIWPIKQDFGGVHIFQHRNLWRQWNSYLQLKLREVGYFYYTVSNIISYSQDGFIEYLRQCLTTELSSVIEEPGLELGGIFGRLGDEDAFAIFMALHLYLNMHAEVTADIIADVTLMARDSSYRVSIEQEIRHRTGLQPCFADIAEHATDASGVCMGPVDWNRINEYGKVVARMLSGVADHEHLLRRADNLIEATRAEMEADRKPPAPCITSSEMTRLPAECQFASLANRVSAEAVDGEAGISFVVRVRNEESVLAQSLASLQSLRIPHEIIIILHRCTDRSASIARSIPGARVLEYAQPISRAGFETLVTPANSPYSLISYYNWCFGQARKTWCFKWDADHVASAELITFLNEQDWADATPTRIRVPAMLDGFTPQREPFLFKAGVTYAKYIFWEYNKSIFAPGVREQTISAPISHASPMDKIKSYWRAPPWFSESNDDEASVLRSKYEALVRIVGPEPRGLARAMNPACDEFERAVREKEGELNSIGIYLWM